VSGHLNPGGQQFRHDHGDADPQVAAALAAYQAGKGSEQAALAALAGARLLVPVVAVLAGGSAAGDEETAGEKTAGDKNSEMVLPTLIGNDGRPAVLAFTGVEALARWRRDARPVPAEAARVWRAAVTDGCAVVIDVAGPVPLAVEGARLAALAAGHPVPPAHQDPDVRAEVEAAVAAEPLITGFGLAAGTEEGPGAADLAVRLNLAPDDGQPADWQATVNRAASRIAGRLAGRLRRGIEFSAARDPIGS
jgi:type III secretion system (T3SS) SseB-like protein